MIAAQTVSCDFEVNSCFWKPDTVGVLLNWVQKSYTDIPGAPKPYNGIYKKKEEIFKPHICNINVMIFVLTTYRINGDVFVSGYYRDKSWKAKLQ